MLVSCNTGNKDTINSVQIVKLWKGRGVISCYLFLASKKGFDVKSYGVGSMVKLPGASVNEPMVYPFGTAYETMYQDLYNKDPHLYH